MAFQYFYWQTCLNRFLASFVPVLASLHRSHRSREPSEELTVKIMPQLSNFLQFSALSSKRNIVYWQKTLKSCFSRTENKFSIGFWDIEQHCLRSLVNESRPSSLLLTSSILFEN
jgi:hypothetical protein